MATINELIVSSQDNLLTEIANDPSYITSEDFFTRYGKLEELAKIINGALDNVKQAVKEQAEQLSCEVVKNNSEPSFKQKYGTITYVPDSIDVNIKFQDSKFEEEQPEVYKECCNKFNEDYLAATYPEIYKKYTIASQKIRKGYVKIKVKGE